MTRLIDTHVHLWTPESAPIDWLSGTALPREADPAAFAEASAGIEVEAFIAVEAAVRAGFHMTEASWLQSLALSESRLQGIVAHAPLERGALVAANLKDLAALPLVKGVRRLLQDDPDPALCLREGFLEGLRLLPAHGLHFEICVYHRQLEAAVEMVRLCPEVDFVLDHIAKPGIRLGLVEPWHTLMRRLAKLPNVTCKLSGVATEADPDAWTEAGLRPYIDHAIDVFGPARTMFGGDWPVSTRAIAYPRWVEIALNALEGYGAEEVRQILRGTARRVYRLEG